MELGGPASGSSRDGFMPTRAQNPPACFVGTVRGARYFTDQAQHVPFQAEAVGAPATQPEMLAYQVLLFIIQRTVEEGIEPLETLSAIIHARAPIR